MFRVRLAAFVACAVLAFGCRPNFEDAYSRVHSDSGIRGPSYEQITSNLQTLAQNSEGHAVTTSYGQSQGGRQLIVTKVASPGVTPKKGVVITGAIHGDEFLDIAHKLPQFFVDNRSSGDIGRFLQEGGVIYVAPILNPDGYSARRREGNSGQDLNRDFPLKSQNFAGKRQTEIAKLTDYLQQESTTQNMQIVFTLDYHCCQGSLIYPWGYSQAAKLEPAVETQHKQMAQLMLREFSGYKSGRVWDLLQYTALGGSTDYYHEEFKAQAFTFEGAYQVEAQNFDKHTRMWTSIIQSLASSDQTSPGPTTPSASNAIFLKLPDANGKMAVATASLDAAKMTLCEGNFEQCRSATPLVTFSTGSAANGAKIFSAPSAITWNANTTYTVLVFNASNQLSSYRSFQLQPKG